MTTTSTTAMARNLLRALGVSGARPSAAAMATWPGAVCDGRDDAATAAAAVAAAERPLRVTLVEGTGAGPAVCDAVRKVLAAAAVPVRWDVHATTWCSTGRDPRTGGPAVRADLLRSAAATGLVLRGPHTGLAADGSDGSPGLALNKALGAFVGVRVFASADGHQPHGHVRVVNVRDTVSGENAEIEHTVTPGVVQTIKTVTTARSEAVARYAFDYATAHGHCRVTALHKANVMRLSDGLFLSACRRVSALYPLVDYEEVRLDKFCLRVTDDPDRYDVLLTPSLYGAVASAVCGALSGGPSTVPSAAYGPSAAVFSTMDHDGQSGHAAAANPTGLIRSAVWMLRHAGRTDAALRVDEALNDAIRAGVRTRDMGGTASCDRFADAVVHNLLHPGTCAGSDNVR